MVIFPIIKEILVVLSIYIGNAGKKYHNAMYYKNTV